MRVKVVINAEEISRFIANTLGLNVDDVVLNFYADRFGDECIEAVVDNSSETQIKEIIGVD